MLLVGFIWAAEFGVPDLFLLSKLRELQDGGLLHAIRRVLIPLSRKMKANIMRRGLQRALATARLILCPRCWRLRVLMRSLGWRRKPWIGIRTPRWGSLQFKNGRPMALKKPPWRCGTRRGTFESRSEGRR